MLGGAWQVGTAYYLRPSCFIDVNYDFMVTGNYTHNYPVSVTSQSNGLTYDSQINYSVIQRVWAQSLTVSLNLMF